MAKNKLEADARTLGVLRSLAKMACTKEEAAAHLGVSRPTLWKFLDNNQDAADAWERGFDEAKTSLRRMQWKHAKTNVAMAIFLGKQLLGQRDAIGLDHSGKIDTNESVMRDGIQRKLARVSEAESAHEVAKEPIES